MSTRTERLQRNHLEKALRETRAERDKAEALLAARTKEWNDAAERIRQLERAMAVARHSAEIIIKTEMGV